MLDLLFRVTSEHDIGTPACHIGGDGDCTGTTGLGNDLGLTLVEFGIQHFVMDLVLLEALVQIL